MPHTEPAAFLGRLLLVAGLILVGLGLLLMVGPRLPFLGRLPGDLVWSRGNVRVYLPLASSLLLSLLLTLLLALLSRLHR
jgi:hypothetical protein